MVETAPSGSPTIFRVDFGVCVGGTKRKIGGQAHLYKSYRETEAQERELPEDVCDITFNLSLTKKHICISPVHLLDPKRKRTMGKWPLEPREQSTTSSSKGRWGGSLGARE